MVTGTEAKETVLLVVQLSTQAVDSLPLPLLVVLFLACLALLQWPFSPPPPVLPTHSPEFTNEKDRLSPLPPAYRLPQPHPQPGAIPAGAQAPAPLLHAQTYPLAHTHTSPDKAARTRRLVGRCGRRWSMPFDAVEEETESSVGEV